MRNGNMHTARMAQNSVTGGQVHACGVAKHGYVLLKQREPICRQSDLYGRIKFSLFGFATHPCCVTLGSYQGKLRGR